MTPSGPAGVKSGELHVTADILAGIFQCQIRSWADPRIAAVNDGLGCASAFLSAITQALQKDE